MSEESKEDRTEQASHRRVQKSEEDGDLPLGKDMAMWAGMGAGAIALYVTATPLRDSLVRLVAAMGHGLHTANVRDLGPYVGKPAAIAGLVCAATALGAAIPVMVQTKLRIWPQLAMPKLERVFSAGKLTRMFKGEFAIDLLIAVVKIVTIAWTLWAIMRDDFVTLPRLLTASTGAELTAVFAPIADGLAKILTAVAILSGVDLALTRYRHGEKMKMTKEELKREYKEDEGDPIFKSRRKRQARELLKNRVKVEVPKADALLVNPTHIAIAIRYRPGEDAAPRVTAKGKGQLAEYMRELAREHGIPIVEDIPLARLLYKRVKVGRMVPADTFKAVAAILAFVYRVLGRNGAGRSVSAGGGR